MAYHQATKHSEVSVRASAHYLDWDNKPTAFKSYPNRPSVPLPHNFPHPKRDALNAVGEQMNHDVARNIDLAALAEILFFSAGLTRKVRFGRELHYMRAASATGALYPIELYVVCSEIDGLNAGVYHFDPLNFDLVRLREGQYDEVLAGATGNSTSVTPLTIVFTSLAWRNAWKYQARSYRHWFWDAGVIAANLLSTCFCEGIPVKLKMSFVDSEVDRLLGLEPGKEATVAVAAIGEPMSKEPQILRREMVVIGREAGESSNDEVEYPIIWDANNASALHDALEVEKWRNSLMSTALKPDLAVPRFPIDATVTASPLLERTILQRGSTRRFAQRPISFAALSSVIRSSTGRIPLDFLEADTTLIEFYLIANDVEGLPSGSYYYNREAKVLEKLKEGRMRYVSGYLCLEQLLFSDASVVFFLMADLAPVLASLGGRGYRAAQFEAGIRAGKIYLASYAQGIGASGSTFYDDAVTEFFSPPAKALSALIAVAVGVPAYRAKPGTVLPQFGP